MDNAFDVIVIGGGMAGVSVGAMLAKTRKVLLIEREGQPAYHSTGRSAALFSEIYGSETVRALTRGSRNFFFDPRPDFTSHALVRQRGAMWLARQDQMQRLDAHASQSDVKYAYRFLRGDEVCKMCPIVRADYVAGGLLEADASDIDVHEVSQGYLRLLRALGGRLVTDAEVTAFDRRGKNWVVGCGDKTYQAPIIVNAAGAWADEVASMAGQKQIGLQPMRRTAVLVDPPAEFETRDWPFVVDTDEEFYFKPDAGALLLSPADETPSLPCDAQADEMDIATAIDRIERATTLKVRRVRHKWAGLRTFTSDRNPVVGFSSPERNFFWLAGQGGFGIQTAPALARLAANWIEGQETPADLLEQGLNPSSLLPDPQLRQMPPERNTPKRASRA